MLQPDPPKFECDAPTQVLSIVETVLGHKTYVELMSKFVSQSGRSTVDIFRFEEGRTTGGKVLRRAFALGRFPGAWGKRQNLDFYRTRAQLGNSFLAHAKAETELRRKRYSALHFHTQSLALLSSALMTRVPTVITIDFTSDLASREYTSPAFRWTHFASKRLDTRVFRTAHRVVSWSELTRQSVIHDHGIPKDRVVVIRPGVDIDLIDPPPDARRNRSGRPRLLFVGNDFERKGGHDCFSVFHDGLSRIADLDVVSNSSLVKSGPGVTVHRNVTAYSAEWLKLFHEAGVFVFPTHSDACPLVVIEAMAAGLPVISTDIYAIPEMVAHNYSGYLVSPRDRVGLRSAVQGLLSDPAKRLAFGDTGRQIAMDRFSAAKNFRRLEDELVAAASHVAYNQ